MQRRANLRVLLLIAVALLGSVIGRALPRPRLQISAEASTQQNANAASTNTSASASAPATSADSSAMVWVNIGSGAYYKPGSRYYGKTKRGKYMLEADAIRAGYHAATKK